MYQVNKFYVLNIKFSCSNFKGTKEYALFGILRLCSVIQEANKRCYVFLFPYWNAEFTVLGNISNNAPTCQSNSLELSILKLVT